MASKIIKEKTCVRRIRFSTSCESTAQKDDSIKVYARLKPSANPKERTFTASSTSIQYRDRDKRGNEKITKYMFHKAFSSDVDQDELYRKTIDQDMDQFIGGANRLLFTYGTTSSGKTYTILGNNRNPGLLPRCTVKLFLNLQDYMQATRLCPDQGCDTRSLTDDEFYQMIDLRDYITNMVEVSEPNNGKAPKEINGFSFERKEIVSLLNDVCETMNDVDTSFVDEEAVYSVWLSYMEVYNENIYDLFEVFPERKPLKIGLDSKKDNYVKGLRHIQVTTWIDLWKLFLFGRSRLHINITGLNKSSSRSHSVFTIKLLKMVDDKFTVNCLSLCDLAGNERQKKTLNSGEAFNESKSINSSLMNLNKCFRVIRENKATGQQIKPPYRESKLTMIFQKAFSYGEHITMIINLSQSASLIDESINTLKISAIAQEMVKPLKQMNHFLKPNSRFSIICTDPSLPIFSHPSMNGESGVMLLPTSSVSQSNDEELIKTYESKIKNLKEELEKKEEQEKALLEIVEDARSEYLNLETKYEEYGNKLEENEIEMGDLETDLEELEWRYSAQTDILRQIEDYYAESKSELETVKETLDESTRKNVLYEIRVKELEAKLQEIQLQQEAAVVESTRQNLLYEARVKELEATVQEMQLQPQTAKKGRPLLSTLDHLENDESEEDLSIHPTNPLNPMANSTEIPIITDESQTVRPLRKCRKNILKK